MPDLTPRRMIATRHHRRQTGYGLGPRERTHWAYVAKQWHAKKLKAALWRLQAIK